MTQISDLREPQLKAKAHMRLLPLTPALRPVLGAGILIGL